MARPTADRAGAEAAKVAPAEAAKGRPGEAADAAQAQALTSPGEDTQVASCGPMAGVPDSSAGALIEPSGRS